jgi:hypothetical protein
MAQTATQRMTAAVCRLFQSHGLTPLLEYQLINGRRIDVACIGKSGRLLGCELKASVSDFNRDMKWADTMAQCFIFYFAVPLGFNQSLIHPGIRVITIDGDHARITRHMGRGLLTADRWHEPRTSFAVKPTSSPALLRAAPPGDIRRSRLWVP